MPVDGRDLALVRRGELVVQEPLQRELDVVGGERASVLELDALAQLKFEGAAVDDFVALRQIRHRVHLGVELNQTVEDAPDDVEFRDQGRLAGIERVDDVVAGDAGAQRRLLSPGAPGPAG